MYWNFVAIDSIIKNQLCTEFIQFAKFAGKKLNFVLPKILLLLHSVHKTVAVVKECYV
jgi:hypothetical protein